MVTEYKPDLKRGHCPSRRETQSRCRSECRGENRIVHECRGRGHQNFSGVVVVGDGGGDMSPIHSGNASWIFLMAQHGPKSRVCVG